MNRNKTLLFLPVLLLAAFTLSSCSGPKGGGVCKVNCGGSGSARLVLTMRSTPLTPPAGTNILSFVVNVTGISLTPSSGGPVVVSASSIPVDFARAQSDSTLLAIAPSLTAQNYTSMTMGFSAPTLTYCKQPTPGTQGCASGTVQTITGNLSTPQIPLTLSLGSGQMVGLEINLDIATAITISNQAVTAVNLAATNAFSTKTLPPSASSLASGQLDFLENLLGVVTQVSGQTVTVSTALEGTVTATGSSSTFYSANCVLNNNNGNPCPPTVGQFVSIDTAVNADGSLALLEFDPISALQIVWLEGVVTATPSSSTQFQIVVTDQSAAGSNIYRGNIINVTLVPAGGAASGLPFPFFIDSKGFPIPANTFANSTDATTILPGMTVGLHVIQFTAPSGNTPGSMTTDIVVLGFTPVPGAVASTGGPNVFSIQSEPPFFGLTTSNIVQLGTGNPATNFDGAPGTSGLTNGQTVAIRALYFGQNTATPFVAAKVRAF